MDINWLKDEFAWIRKEFDGVRQQFDGVRQQFDAVNSRIQAGEDRFNELSATMVREFAKVNNRLDGWESRMPTKIQIDDHYKGVIDAFEAIKTTRDKMLTHGHQLNGHEKTLRQHERRIKRLEGPEPPKD